MKRLEQAKALLAEGLINIKTREGITKINQAIDIFSRCIENDPMNAHILLLRASSYVALKDEENALKDYTRIKLLDPSNPRILDELGVGLLRLNQFRDALECFDKVISATKKDPDKEKLFSASFNRSLVYLYQGELNMAEKELELLVKEQPATSGAYSLVGNLNEYLGNNNKAEMMYREAIKLAPTKKERAKEYWTLGELYRRNMFYDQALKIYRLGMETSKETLSNLFGVWETLIEQGKKLQRLDDCIAVARKIAEKSLRFRFTLALLQMYANNNKEAIQEYQTFINAIESNPLEWGIFLKPEVNRAKTYIHKLKENNL